MKILFVSHEKNRNGSTVSMITLITMLIYEFKCEIHVLLPGHGEAEKELLKYNIPYEIIDYYPNYRKIGAKKPVRECIKELINKIAVFKINKIISKGNYDFVCSNSSALDVAARAAIVCGVPHIYYIREFMEEDFSLEYRNKKRMRFLLEASDKVIFVSKAVENKYTAIYNLKSFKTFYNGINISQYYIEKHTILVNDYLELIQVGGLLDGKGTMQLVEFINKAKDAVKCRLTLVGRSDKKYLRTLKKYIKCNHLEDNISIKPYAINIIDFFKGKDIMVVNSRSEGFGRVTVEGMLGGLLVLGRDSGGTSEIIEHNTTGILYRNINEFCDYLHDINNNREVYRKIALSGQKEAYSRYQPSNVAANFIEYLGEKA